MPPSNQRRLRARMRSRMHLQKRRNEAVICPVFIRRYEAVEFNWRGQISGDLQAFGKDVRQVDARTCVPEPLRHKQRINGDDHAGMTPMQIW